MLMNGVLDNQALSQVRAESLRRMGRLPTPVTLDGEVWINRDLDAVRRWRLLQLSRLETDPAYLASAKAYYAKNCEAFINHWCDTYDPRLAGKGPVWMPFILFQRQADLVGFVQSCLEVEEVGLVEKSRTMGASWVCVAISVWMWLFWDMSAIGWGSQDQPSVDRLGDPKSIFEKIRLLIQHLPAVFRPAGIVKDRHMTFMKCINPENGASIVGEVGDNIGRGGRTRLYFVDEAAHLRRPEMVEGALLETTRVRIDVSSVSGLGTTFYNKRMSGEMWEPGQLAVRGTTNVFVMDWSTHPEKSEVWHEERRNKLENDGLSHVFAREVDRNYAASVEGVIILAEYVSAAIDAHIKLGFEASGMLVAGQDISDGGRDKNAYAGRRGPVLLKLDKWVARDVGVTTRKAIGHCQGEGKCILGYDSIGVGSGFKAEANRFTEDDPELAALVREITFVPWNAAAAVIDPYKHVVEDQDDSPLNREIYHNLKAQGWWELRRRFERTWRAINDPDYEWHEDQLISLPSDLPFLPELRTELSQAVSKYSPSMKLIVDKSPEGTVSPNLADAVVMAFWPAVTKAQPAVSLVVPRTIRG